MVFSIVPITAGLGAMLAHEVSDRFGRRGNFLCTQFVGVTGVTLCALSISYEMILVGRCLVGVSMGIGMSIHPMYISETAPAEHRGKLTTWAELSTNMGIVLGFFFNWLFQDLPENVNWRVMLLCGIFLPTLLIVLTLTFMPESPRWLITKGRTEEARAVLRRTHPQGTDIDAVVRGINADIEQAELRSDHLEECRFPCEAVPLHGVAGLLHSACSADQRRGRRAVLCTHAL